MKFFLKKEDLTETFKSWIPLGFIITMVFLGMAGTAQQIIRQSANDLQIEKADSLINDLEYGSPLPESFAKSSIDIEKSGATFSCAFDKDGKNINSDYTLAGKIVYPPQGVFDYAKKHGEDKVTWQPKKGVRTAIVVKYYKTDSGSGFAMAGRSLKESETRIHNILMLILVGWLITIIGSYKLSLIFRKKG